MTPSQTSKCCSVEGCDGDYEARGLCGRHYDWAYRHGTLDEHPTIEWHSIEKFDLENLIGRCSVCGDVDVYYRANRGRVECQNARRASRRASCEARVYLPGDRGRKYGLTADEVDQMAADQEGRCAVCKNPPTDGETLAIDHDHTTGAVRGLLCRKCNIGIGFFQDDPKRLNAAAKYLKAH